MPLKGERRFLVTGHSRSGTKYMSNLFGAFGFSVGHECMKQHGISAWNLAVPELHTPLWCKVQRKDWRFKYVVHVVRNPVKCISSVRHTEKVSLKFREMYVMVDPAEGEFERAAQSWLQWNALVELSRPDVLVRLEDAKTMLSNWFVSTGQTDAATPSAVVARTNEREHPQETWEEIRKLLKPKTAEAVVEMACRYGYAHEVIL